MIRRIYLAQPAELQPGDLWVYAHPTRAHPRDELSPEDEWRAYPATSPGDRGRLVLIARKAAADSSGANSRMDDSSGDERSVQPGRSST